MRPRSPRRPCAFPGCPETATHRTFCPRHYQHLSRAGAFTEAAGPAGQDSNAWKGDDVGFAGMHARLRRDQGPATDFRCASCDARALDWALQPWAAPLRTDASTGREYSADAGAYQPMCRSCHNAMDHATEHARARQAAGLAVPLPAGHRGPLVRWEGPEPRPEPSLFDWPEGVAR